MPEGLTMPKALTIDDSDPFATVAWSLTRGMAHVLDVDLVEAVTDGWFSRAELARLVDDCAECGHAGQCLAWLAVTPQARELPAYCRNKSALEALAP